MRILALLTLSILLAATVAVSPAASAKPVDIETGPCPEGEGMTMDVNGRRIQDCEPPLVWHCDGGVSVAGVCAKLGAAPTTNTDRPFPVEACGGRGEFAVQVVDPAAPTSCIRILRVTGCYGGSMEIEVLNTVQIGQCGICCPPSSAEASMENPVKSCGDLAYQVSYGPVSTSCIQVIEVYYCPGGGGYFVILGQIQTGACRPCCSPLGESDAERPLPAEVCQGPGGLAIRFNEPLPDNGCMRVISVHPCYNGQYEVRVLGQITINRCPPCCVSESPEATAIESEAIAPVELRPRCNAHYPSWQAYVSGKAVGPCVFLVPFDDATTADDAPPRVEVRSCPPRGVQVYVNGNAVTSCIGTNGRPVEVDFDCARPDNGVQVTILGSAQTRCYPLPSGV